MDGKLKVIAINGSPRKGGNTAHVLGVMANELEQQGIEVEILHIGRETIRGCTACGYCLSSEEHRCSIKDDIVNEASEKMRDADGLILASPTYYAGIAGAMKSFLDRVFYSSSRYFRYKAATSISVVRRAGGVDVVHQLNNYLQLAQTIMPPSQYWTSVYGMAEGDAQKDEEGIQTIRKNAQAMGWLMRVLDAGKKQFPIPKNERRCFTNFIR